MRRHGIGVLAGVLTAVPLALHAQSPGNMQLPDNFVAWNDISDRLLDLLPPLRAGQWEIQQWNIQGDRLPLRIEHPSVKVCIDDAATKRNWWKVHLIPLAARYCPGKSDAKRVGAEWMLEETCELSSGRNLVRLERKTTISGDSQSTIDVRIEDKGWRGGSVAPFQARTVRWVAAACTDGMKPGDTKEFRREGSDTRELTTEELKEYRRVYP